MKLTLVNNYPLINSTGGSEKIFCSLANALTGRGHDVTGIYFDNKTGKPLYPLSDKVKLSDAGKQGLPVFSYLYKKLIISIDINKDRRRKKRALLSANYTTLQLKKSLNHIQSDAFIAFQPETAYALLTIGKKPVYLMLHSSPDKLSFLEQAKDVLAGCKVIQVLQPEYIQMARNIVPNSNIIYIPNPVYIPKQKSNHSNKKIIYLGRISKGKRIELLIKSFHRIQNDFPSWTVEIWGPLKPNDKYQKQLLSLVKDLSLEERVFFRGHTNKIYDVLSSGSIFAFPSECEGFSLSLTEAMSTGLACIACGDCTGISSLLNNSNAVLCSPTVDDFSKHLSMLMKTPLIRIQLGDQAVSSMQKYSPDLIWDSWDSLLTKNRLTDITKSLR